MVVTHVVAFVALLFVASAQQNGVSLGEFSNLAHELGGNVFAIDSRTFEIRNFNYDGTGPAAFFWVGKGNLPSRDGFAIPLVPDCDANVKLGGYSASTSRPLRVELPEGTTMNDIDYLSVWCEQAVQNFGHVLIPAAAKSRIPNASGRPQCAPKATFPVQNGWNCENLVTGYQVRWKRNGANIDFELVAKVTPQQWISFGVSGSQTSTSMDNSDVVIATEINGRPRVFDYFMNSRGPCAAGVGVCPDTSSNTGPGKDDISNISGNRTLDTLMVRYTRPIAANEPTDRPFFVDGGRKTFAVWAIGPYNAQSNLPQIHRGEMSRATVDVSYDFARTPVDNCRMPIVAREVEEKKVLEPWDRPTLSGITDFTARIGPSGGNKGVAAITQADSWGIAWYISETGTTGRDVLIPAIGVERGKTYTFRVFGGDDPNNRAAYHPMYITSDPDGGFATKGSRGRARETIYAGIEVTNQNSSGIHEFTFTAAGPLCEYKQPPGVEPTSFNTFDAYYNRLNRSCVDRVPDNDAGVLRWTVPTNLTENTVYYHCATHGDLGYKLVVFDEGKVDQDVLKAASVVTAQQSGEGEQVCKDTFKGQEVTYSGCHTTADGNMRVFWRINGDDIDTMFVGRTAGYAGLGWGHRSMVPANAVMAYVDEQGDVQVGDFALESRSAAGVRNASNQGISRVDGELRNGEIAAIFTRPLAGTENVPTLDPDGEASFIYAIGDAPTAGPVFPQHSARDSATVDLGASGSSAGAGGINRRAYFIAHAVMMGLAWALLTPMAIVIMRFFKKLNPTTFQLHRGLNSLSVLLTLVAFVMGVVQGSHTSRSHLAIGVIVTVFALSQGINGALRPGKGTPNRSKWFWAHMGSGYVAYILAVANLAIGWKLLAGGFNIGGVWWLLFAVPLVLTALAGVGLSFFPRMFPITEKQEDAGDNPLAEHEVM